MLRALILTGSFLFLATSAPLRAENQKTPLERQVEALAEKVRVLQTDAIFQGAELTKLNEQLSKLMTVLGNSEARISSSFTPKDPETQSRLDLQNRVRDLEDLVRRLEGRVATLERSGVQQSSYVRTGSTVKVTNYSGRNATVYINNLPYRLLPDETKTLEGMSAGPFTYEVYLNGLSQPWKELTTLRLYGTGDTYNLTINPPSFPR